MSNPLVYGSVASGIEAATVAWHKLGWKPAWFSEIEPFPCRVLEHHYPDVPNLGDMNYIFRKDVFKQSNINVLVGGTPCQSFSVAGLGKGLADPRGQLSLTFAEIAARKRPEWLVWENVPGVLSSNGGEDFATFLGLLTGREISPPENGFENSGCIQGISAAYGIAWRVLDAQYFGVAQRRRRVFVVGYLGDWRRASAVLFERESLSGYFNESEAKRQGIARKAKESVGTGGEWWNGEHIAGTLTKHNANGVQRMPDKDNFGAVIVPHYYALAENLIGRKPENGGNGSGITEDGPMYTLNTSGVPGVCVVYDSTQISSPTNMSNPKEGDPCHTLSKAQHPPLLVQDRPIVVHGTQDPVVSDIAYAQGRNNGGENVILVQNLVRRLTPLECERLQGFPDNYTKIPGAKDSPRYAAIGNSMAIDVMEWIGRRIQTVNDYINEQAI